MSLETQKPAKTQKRHRVNPRWINNYRKKEVEKHCSALDHSWEKSIECFTGTQHRVCFVVLFKVTSGRPKAFFPTQVWFPAAFVYETTGSYNYGLRYRCLITAQELEGMVHLTPSASSLCGRPDCPRLWLRISLWDTTRWFHCHQSLYTWQSLFFYCNSDALSSDAFDPEGQK